MTGFIDGEHRNVAVAFTSSRHTAGRVSGGSASTIVRNAAASSHWALEPHLRCGSLPCPATELFPGESRGSNQPVTCGLNWAW